MTSLLIADDHPMVRRGYRQFFEGEPTITEIGEAATGREVLGKVRQRRWDVLLLDLHMPDRSGFDILRHLTASYPELRVLVTSGLPENQYAITVMREGAKGYLSKDCDPDELMLALRTVLSGQRYMSAGVKQLLIDSLDKQGPPNARDLLTFREFQVCRKLASGASLGEIARELSLSAKTVSTYRSTILKALQLRTTAELTSYAMRTGLIQ